MRRRHGVKLVGLSEKVIRGVEWNKTHFGRWKWLGKDNEVESSEVNGEVLKRFARIVWERTEGVAQMS